MRHTAKLRRLETAVQRLPAKPVEPRDEAGWLVAFEAWGRAGHFAREPDFPAALAYYRDALERAETSTDPPFDPPAEFMAYQRLQSERRACWRTWERFPDVRAGFDWLAEMLGRVVEGVPLVTEAEFGELAAWFAAHEARLNEVSLPSQSLDAGEGRAIGCAQVRYDLRRGPRVAGAGRAAEDVRQLRARYGEDVCSGEGGDG